MRRLAALAMVLVLVGAAAPAYAGGWYLIMPPWSPDRAEPYEDMPLSIWRTADVFNDPQECQQKLEWLLRGAAQHTDEELEEARQRGMAARHLALPTPSQTRRILDMSMCIASDDPRLGSRDLRLR